MLQNPHTAFSDNFFFCPMPKIFNKFHLFPALDIVIGRQSWGVESSNMNMLDWM